MYSKAIRESELAVERRRADTDISGVDYRKERTVGGVWERIRIKTEEGARSIGRPMGKYDTLVIGRLERSDAETILDLSDEVARELCALCDGAEAIPERVLVVGLGNPSLTPDAVGPRTAELVEATMHLPRERREQFDGEECSQIAVIIPSVAVHTGLESFDIVKGVCEKTHPDLIIAIDSIACRSPQRLGSSIQFCDTGIAPGAGMSEGVRVIDRGTMGVPVISVGVPTVIDARLLCRECELEGEELYVCPKDVSTVVEVASRIIAGGINQAFGINAY